MSVYGDGIKLGPLMLYIFYQVVFPEILELTACILSDVLTSRWAGIL